MSKPFSRRNFIEKIPKVVAVAILTPFISRYSYKQYELKRAQLSSNDNIQVALIDVGGIGYADTGPHSYRWYKTGSCMRFI